MQFSALNSDSNLNQLSPRQSSQNGTTATKEALESDAFKLYYQGLSLQQEGKLEEARDSLVTVLDSPYLAHSLHDTDRKVSSELLKGKACKLKLLCLRNLACICEETEQWEECVSWCKRALEIEDTDGMLWYRLGRASLRLYELELCVHALSETLTRSPYITPARKTLISVLYAIYRYDECLTHCSLLLARTPHAQMATDYASWILKSQPYIEPPSDSDSLKPILAQLSFMNLSSLKQSPHLKDGKRLRVEYHLAFPPTPELEAWTPDTSLSSHSWLELGVFLLAVLKEADEKGKSLHPCVLLREETETRTEEQMDTSRGEEGEKKQHKRRGPDCFDFLPVTKRRSLRSSQQMHQLEEKSHDVLNKDMQDLVTEFIANRWSYFSQPHCMDSHPSSSHKPAPASPDPRLLLRLQPPLEGEKERVELFLRSHSLSPICSILLRFLEASAQIFLLAWPESCNHKLQSLISEVYLICHGRFLFFSAEVSNCSLETAYVILMFIEIVAYQSTVSRAVVEISLSILEAAHFLEQICHSPVIPPKQWYSFFLRSCWSLSQLAQLRGLNDRQISLLNLALQVFDLYNSASAWETTLKSGPVSSQDSQLSDSSNLDGFSLEYPPDELTVIHPNIHTVISKILIQENIEKAMMSHSRDREIIYDYFLRGEKKRLIDSIKPFLSNLPSFPFSFLLAPLDTGADNELTVNLIHLCLECIRSSREEEMFFLAHKILSNLVISLSDKIEATQDATSTAVDTELRTLSSVIALFLFKQERGELKLESSSLFEGFVWCLLKILQFHWDIQNSVSKKLLPISPTICLLFHCIRLHDRLPDTSLDITAESDKTTELQIDLQEDTLPSFSPPPNLGEKKSQLAQSKLNRINPGLCFLLECHELFGSERLCCSHQGLLLHLLLQETSSSLLSLESEETCVREMLQEELIQIIFCLFGYPAKKFRSLGLSEHRESDEFLPGFHWPSCYLMLSHLCPSTLPSFDDNKSVGVSPDLTLLCKRVAEHLPYQEYTLISTQQLETFIESEANSFPVDFSESAASHESQCISRVYYVIADDYLKIHSSRAIEFYTKHLLFHPTHSDSWAGLALANFRKFQAIVSERKLHHAPSYVADITATILRVSKCFRQANRLYPSHSQLLEKFGHFCFHVNSFWRHLSRSLVLPETGEVYGDLPTIPHTEAELEISLSVFQKALDFESHIAEPWLYHYLLAKIKMKLGRPHAECFSHLTASSRILHADGASYLEHVDCNSTNYACEVIEVHYLIHSYFIKSLLRARTQALAAVEEALLALKKFSPLSSSSSHDTSIGQCVYTHKSQILQLLGVSESPEAHRFIEALVGSLHGLLVCLVRFPTHYKPHYRLVRTLWDISPEIFYESVKALLIGPIQSSDFKNDKLLPLFNLRSNLFANMWALKSYDINRPGSFVYHMYRHATLLFSFLSYRHSVEALISVVSLLKVKPEPAKMYLREFERVLLYNTGLLITATVLEKVCSPEQIHSQMKPLTLLKISYILRSYCTKSSLPDCTRDELQGKLDKLLLKLFRVYRGPPPTEDEYPLEKVLNFCAQHTSVSPAEQSQHIKKSCKAKPNPTQPVKPKPTLPVPPTSL